MSLTFGHMPDFGDQFEEIAFAREHFDFLDYTFPPIMRLAEVNSADYGERWTESIKEAIGGFPVVGHAHWNIDFSKGAPEQVATAVVTAQVLKRLGARSITVHPSPGHKAAEGLTDRGQIRDLGEIEAGNLSALGVFNNHLRDLGLRLLVENHERPPYNHAWEMERLISQLPGAALALDVGHANLVSEKELDRFLRTFGPSIGHIHLHDNVGRFDHLVFADPAKAQALVGRVKDAGYSGGVTLEMYRHLPEGAGKSIDLDFASRSVRLIEQLKWLRGEA